MKVKRKQISIRVERLLWGVAAGRCEFNGCNKLLYIHDTSGFIENLAEKAHIYAVKPLGARYIEYTNQNCINNLMLVCQACHTIIDRNPDRFPSELLYDMKIEHENRIRIVSSIDINMKSHIVYYTANISSNHMRVNDCDAMFALTSIDRYPAGARPIDLSVHGRYLADRDSNYYTENMQNLKRAVIGQVANIIENGESIALFAIAPQPLLIYLGCLLNDKYNISVFQCHRRDIDKWSWHDPYSPIDFMINFQGKTRCNGRVALVLALSSSVIENRITDVLGKDASIYTVTIENPSRIFVKHPLVMESFIEKSRESIELIKQKHGNKEPIHVFPVMPVSLAVRFGMDYMPKTDNPLIIYDEVAGQGFVQALEIGEIL